MRQWGRGRGRGFVEACRRRAILQSSCIPPSSHRCGSSVDVAPAARAHARWRRCNLVHRRNVAARPTSPPKEGCIRPLLERTAHLCNIRGHGRAYCIIPRTLLLKCYAGCNCKERARGTIRLRRSIHHPTAPLDPRIRFIMRGDIGGVQTLGIAPYGAAPSRRKCLRLQHHS